MERLGMPYDDVAWEAGDNMRDEWISMIRQDDTMRAIGRFIMKYRDGTPIVLGSPRTGSFNLVLRMTFQDGGAAIIRFTQPGASMFPDESVRNEVAVMRYLQKHTNIPVPNILHWGTKEESPLGVGAFIIMEYVDHEMSLGAALNSPDSEHERVILDANISEDKLRFLYRQLADIVLQLSRLTFPAVGSLEQTGSSTWEVTHRPVTFNMNELVRLGTLPRRKLFTTPFPSTASYFEALAKLNMDHLSAQRNDAVDSQDDCEKKYIARHLFRQLAQDDKLTPQVHNAGPFRLWCDDLRPSNVLVDKDLRIVAVIDWEFTYAAPPAYTNAPPWWLLLEQPEFWPSGMDDWSRTFENRLRTFLEVLAEEEEAAMSKDEMSDEEERLSAKMQKSWDSGDFWFVFGVRKSFAFDALFWDKIYPRFFEQDRVARGWRGERDLLTAEERDEMRLLVEQKLGYMGDRKLAWEPFETAEPVDVCVERSEETWEPVQQVCVGNGKELEGTERGESTPVLNGDERSCQLHNEILTRQ